jgi:SAM-dependent methyltransferase
MLYAKTFPQFLLRLLVILAILYIGILLAKRAGLRYGGATEGFQQEAPYILKDSATKYDDFYAGIYNDLYLTKSRAAEEYDQVIRMTEPSVDYSVFLDVGSGTGELAGLLSDRGFQVYGIDRSAAMVKQALLHRPELQIRIGDVTVDPMAYDRNRFSHILCMYMTIYEIEDKYAFFANCYAWMKSGGYLVLHLADKARFNPIVPAGTSKWLRGLQESYGLMGKAPRITKTELDFVDFQYRAAYEFPQGGAETVVFKETFENDTQIRKNESILYMNSTEYILGVARDFGFYVKGQVDMKGGIVNDPYQYIYVLEKGG